MKDLNFVLFYFSVGVSSMIAQTDYNKADEKKKKNGVWKVFIQSPKTKYELSNMEKKLEF
jgi:hypothetical protein